MAEAIRAGIDLGTTFSTIAVVDQNGQPQAIPNAEGELATPSVVHANADGSFIVGTAALAHASDTARVFKRFMGSPQTYPLAGRDYTPEQLSAEVLRKLTDDAAVRLGGPVRDVVISVPAYFGQLERDATRRAGELVGLTVLQMINEPTAAASVYTQRQRLEQGHLLIFDLGGGTFDITLLEATESGPFVKRTGGSINLGGQDFTDTFVAQFGDRYREAYNIELLGDAQFELNRQVEKAKITLSTAPSAEVSISTPAGPTMPITLTRGEFEEGIESYLMEMRTIIELLLDRANLAPGNIRKVLLVGGSSRIPAVRAALTGMFGQAPDESLNPDLAVAWGAALAAAGFRAGGLVASGGGLRIADSVSHSIGVKALQAGTNRYVLDAVLPHGFPLEKLSEPRFYRPEQAGDTFIGVEIFEGDIADLSGCTKVGYLPVPLPPGGGPDNTAIRIWMKLNRSGLLEIQVAINDEQPHGGEFHL